VSVKQNALILGFKPLKETAFLNLLFCRWVSHVFNLTASRRVLK